MAGAEQAGLEMTPFLKPFPPLLGSPPTFKKRFNLFSVCERGGGGGARAEAGRLGQRKKKVNRGKRGERVKLCSWKTGFEEGQNKATGKS